MTVAELTDRVQFAVDQQGNITAVMIDPELWKQIVAALENAEDRSLVQSLLARLSLGPSAGGALRWDDVADQWQ